MVAAIKSNVAVSPAGAPVESLVWTENLGREHGFEPLRIEGRLPAQLHGTLYRNGPGQYGQFGTRYSHPFEADGAATAIRIANGAATGASRIHQTAGLIEERAAGKIQYGLSAPWSRRIRNNLKNRQKNTANTNIIVWQDRVFALMEAGKPTEIDPRDLSTIGETDLGVVHSMFSAHPHRVASRNASYNFGLQYGRATKLHLYELPDVGPARNLGAVELGYPPMLHDFIATDTHLVFFVSPTRVDVPRMLLGLSGFEKLFRWKPEKGTEIICVPIDRPTEVLRFTTDAFYQWHFANAFNRANELIVDYIRYPNFDSFYDIGNVGAGGAPEALGEGRMHRATIDLAAKTIRTEQTCDRSCEFPTVKPGEEGREQSITYLAFDNLTSIGSVDQRGAVVSHELAAGERASEPLHVDGHLLVLCHKQGAAYVGVYDAARIPDGPVAKIWIDHHVPITFHGTFARS
ncbi:MAG: carotenoid oxygenase family protein [Deltaproteobacteria bacterium]|nr:carotenoid oxygenase family protein [Deltaproteobacteria bacterium]